MKSEAIAKIKHKQIPLDIFESINEKRFRKEFMNLVFKKDNYKSNAKLKASLYIN